MAVVTYLGHSGFSVRTQDNLLIFDLSGEADVAAKHEDRAVAFISHAHGDHFSQKVIDYHARGLIDLVTGDDVKSAGQAMRPGDELTVQGAQIRAYGSTDQGVSFMVDSGGMRIFHAGDYNLWHWKDESDEAEVRQAEEAFEAILSDLPRGVDIAFFPVDPRMGTDYDEGARRFAQVIRPRWMIPMHFWNQPKAAQLFAQAPLPADVQVVAMTEPGGTIEII